MTSQHKRITDKGHYTYCRVRHASEAEDTFELYPRLPLSMHGTLLLSWERAVPAEPGHHLPWHLRQDGETFILLYNES